MALPYVVDLCLRCGGCFLETAHGMVCSCCGLPQTERAAGGVRHEPVAASSSVSTSDVAGSTGVGDVRVPSPPTPAQPARKNEINRTGKRG